MLASFGHCEHGGLLDTVHGSSHELSLESDGQKLFHAAGYEHEDPLHFRSLCGPNTAQPERR